ncbi:MAG: ankyrin repeat domain-containing protein [Spirochaetaceae bacterium]|nr:ankyrin repeat domain-containing protein [Spirochaetaceae bacterium]
MNKSDFREMLDVLVYAIEKENVEIIKELLKDFNNFTNEQKGLVLHVLSNYLTDTNYEFISKTIFEYFPMEFSDEYGNLLHYACFGKSLKMINSLVENGFDINQTNSFGDTPFLLACSDSSTTVLRFFVEKGIDIFVKNYDDEGALHNAARSSNVENLNYLLSLGLDIEARNNDGFTPYLKAISYQEDIETASEILELLKEAGANVHARDNEGNTDLHLAMKRKSGIITACHLTGRKDKLFAPNNNDETCLDLALSHSDDEELIKMTLQDLKIYLIKQAAQNPNPAAFKALCISGINPNWYDYNGITSLMLTAKNNTNPDIISLLIHESNCSTNAVDLYKRNFLHYAAVNKDKTIYYEYVEEYEHLCVKDEEGHTPQHYLEHPEDFIHIV